MPTGHPRTDLTKALLHRLHWVEKKSVLEMSRILKTDRNTIYSYMKLHGIRSRSQSESGLVRMSKLTKKERMKLTEDAHRATRGRTQPLSEKINRAKTVEKAKIMSDLERAFLATFRAAEIEVTPIYRVHIFNLDFAVPSMKLGIEIDGGNWHQSAKKRRQDAAKESYLSTKGWTVIRFKAEDLPRCVEKTVATIKSLRSHPTT